MKTSTKEALIRYKDMGVPTGAFLRAVLCNQLKESFFLADEQNRADLDEIVLYCYEELPGGCWGNIDKVSNWIKQGGMSAYRNEVTVDV